jgi:hypothetical protein
MEKIMNKIKYLPLAIFVLAASVWAGEEGEMDRPSMTATNTMIVTAVVEAINVETREVRVKKADGQVLEFIASEEARNLGQVAVGDVMVAEYQETVSIEVMANEGYEPQVMAAEAVARTEEGEMPGVAAMEATVITATVEEINIEANTFKLKGPEGNIREFVARNPENLRRSKVGDLVVITITNAVAIVVEKPVAE